MNKLSTDVARLIGSTQVITSVVSVVKELVENSLDAGATNIEVRLESFGLTKVEVRDNGAGIEPDAVAVACKCHYTSKISSHVDLQSLTTYGFRGEALSSLCQVAKVTVATRTADQSHSTQCTINHTGDIVSQQPSHLAKGTTITVRDLFANLPVRKQFFSSLKKKKDQLKEVEDIMMAFGLIHFQIRFSLWHDRSLVWQKNASNTQHSCVMNTLGLQVFTHLQHMRYETNDQQIIIEGYLPHSKENGFESGCVFRKTNDRSFLYVNKRPIRDKDIDKCVKKLFNNDNGNKKWPIMVLDIKLPLSDVDANVAADKKKVATPLLARIISAIEEMVEKAQTKKMEDANKNENITNKESDIINNVESHKANLPNEKFMYENSNKENKNFVDTSNFVNHDKNSHAEKIMNDLNNQEIEIIKTNTVNENPEQISLETDRENMHAAINMPENSIDLTDTCAAEDLNKNFESTRIEESTSNQDNIWSMGRVMESQIQPVKILRNDGGNSLKNSHEKNMNGNCLTNQKRERTKYKESDSYEFSSPLPKKSRHGELNETLDFLFSQDCDFEILGSTDNKENEGSVSNIQPKINTSLKHKNQPAPVKLSKAPRHSFITNYAVVKTRDPRPPDGAGNQFDNNTDVTLHEIKVSAEMISRNLKTEKKQHPNHLEFNHIGNVEHKDNICSLIRVNEDILLVNNHRMHEVYLYQKLLENHKFSSCEPAVPIVIKMGLLNEVQQNVLNGLERYQSPQDPEVFYSNDTLEKNGIKLSTYKDNATGTTMLRVCSLPTDLPSFDLEHTMELLSNMAQRGCSSVSMTRPRICCEYLMSESARISRTVPSSGTKEALKSLMHNHQPITTIQCLHKQPIFHKLYKVVKPK